jgi:hypothetical protein
MAKKEFQPSKLVAAIRAGRLSGVIVAIEDGGDIEEADIHGVPGLPLRVACFEGEMAIVRELLRCGADVNAIAADGPGAPLRLALRGGHGDIAALLLQNDAVVPPGLKIDPAVLDRIGSLSPMPGEAAVPTLPEVEPDARPEPTDNMIEFTRSLPANHSVEEVDLAACYGTDTNMLTMDLLRFNEDRTGATPTPSEPQSGDPKKKKPAFWKSGR